MFSHILLATDGSGEAQKAQIVALDLARRYHSAVSVVHAYAHVPEVLGAPVYDSLLSERTGDGQQILAQASQPFRDAGISVDTELFDGDPAGAILRVAETRGCDLIVVGARGMNELEELLLGSASYHVIHHARCPVLVVR